MPSDITPGSLFANSGGAADQSVQVLSYVFGTPLPGMGGTAGPGAAIFNSFFLTFNTALFALGVSWFAWSIMSATVHTATDGEFLGKRYSSFWFTVRGIVGFAGLVPVAHGWSMAQIFMYAVAMMGIGLANILAGGQVGLMGALAGNSLQPNNSAITRMADASVPPGPEAVSLARNMLQSQVCLQGVNASRAALARDTGTVLDPQGQIACQAGSRQVGEVQYVIEYRCGVEDSASASGRDASCGGFDLSIPEGVAGIDPSRIARARNQALVAMQRDLGTLASEVVAYAQDGPNAAPKTEPRIMAAAKVYEQAVAQATQAELAAATPVIRQSLNQAGGPANGGWVTFGTAFHSYSAQMYQLGNALNAKIEPIPAQGSAEFGANNLYERASNLVSVQQQQSGEAVTGGNSVYKFFAGLPVGAMKMLASNGPDSSSDSIVNPVVFSKELGDDILTATEVAAVGYIGARGVMAALDEGQKAVFDSGVGKVANFLTAGTAKGFISGASAAVREMLVAAGPMLTVLLFALILFGVTLSIYVPLIPFIAWWGGVIQWFVVVAESIIAASLWAFAHLDADGEGLGQRTQHGYIFVLNVLLRPALMVISFIVATLAVMVLGTLLLKLLALAIPQAQTNSMTGIVSFIGFIAVFLSLVLALVHTAFGMTGMITDQVLNWIGGHVGHAFGRDQDERAKQVFVAGVSKAEGAAGRLAGGGGAKKANPLVQKDDD